MASGPGRATAAAGAATAEAASTHVALWWLASRLLFVGVPLVVPAVLAPLGAPAVAAVVLLLLSAAVLAVVGADAHLRRWVESTHGDAGDPAAPVAPGTAPRQARSM